MLFGSGPGLRQWAFFLSFVRNPSDPKKVFAPLNQEDRVDSLRMLTLRDGFRLAYRVRGEGPPLMLLHGFTGSIEAWPDQTTSGLSTSRTLLEVDLHGHGNSSDPTSGERVSMDRVIEDLLDLADALDWGRFHVAGYSMGGRVALGLSVRAPERIRSVILESSSPGLATPEERQRRMEEDQRRASLLRQEGIEAFVDRWMSMPLFATQAEHLTASELESERTRRLQNRPDALAHVLTGLGTGSQPSFWSQLDRATMPALLVVGALDAKFHGLAKDMVARLPNASLVTIQDAGHAVHLEAPDAWLAAVIGFLDELD